VVSFADISDKAAVKLVNDMRGAGISADMDYDFKKMKKQFSLADKNGARFTIILGEDEMNKNAAAVKDMESGEQVEVSLDQIINHISDKLRRN
jgi:histidyl-tRNA synthetase